MIDNTVKVSLEEMYGSDKYKDCYFYFRKPKTSELLRFNQAQVDMNDENIQRLANKKTAIEVTPEMAIAMEDLIANTYVRGEVIGDSGIEALSGEDFSAQFLDMQTVSYVFPVIVGTVGLENSNPKLEEV